MEKSQNPKSFSKIWLWKRLNEGVIFSEFWYFFFKKSGKIPKNCKNSKKNKNEAGADNSFDLSDASDKTETCVD